jgi:hypothetical protein
VAYTASQRADIRLYLGWPATFYASSDALEQAMTTIGSSRPEDEANAIALLTKIADQDDKIQARLDASTWATKTGAIEQRAAYAHEVLRRRGRALVMRLASIHGVGTQSDFFGDKQPPYITRRQGNAGSYELVEG